MRPAGVRIFGRAHGGSGRTRGRTGRWKRAEQRDREARSLSTGGSAIRRGPTGTGGHDVCSPYLRLHPAPQQSSATNPGRGRRDHAGRRHGDSHTGRAQRDPHCRIVASGRDSGFLRDSGIPHQEAGNSREAVSASPASASRASASPARAGRDGSQARPCHPGATAGSCPGSSRRPRPRSSARGKPRRAGRLASD
jgi:hypothetical protein